ncbi:hypothetical protein FI667_g2532, partial [Globisporangium splendens]
MRPTVLYTVMNGPKAMTTPRSPELSTPVDPTPHNRTLAPPPNGNGRTQLVFGPTRLGFCVSIESRTGALQCNARTAMGGDLVDLVELRSTATRSLPRSSMWLAA